MQHPSKFQHIQNVDQIQPFPLAVEELRIDRVNKGPVETTVSYDEQGRVLLELGNMFTQKFWQEIIYQFRYKPIEIQIKCMANSDPYLGYITRIKPQGVNSPIVEASLCCPPISLVDSPSSNRFEALLLSVPQIQELPIFLYDEHGTTFEIGPSMSEEGRVSLIRVYTKKISAINPLTALAPLHFFLTFVKGTNCGLGHLIANDASDSVVLKSPGFTPTDPKNMAAHWFDNRIRDCLPDIFLLFLKACKDEKTNKALRQAIVFYRASNASLPVSLDVAIIAANSALEAIVNHILTHLAKWSNSKIEDTSFAKRSQDATEFFGMEVGSLSQSLELLGYPSESDHNKVFTIISKMRNKLVHQDIKFVCSGKQLIQAWQVTQWLVEVLIFGVIGYRGHMIDRRIFGAHSSKVPLSLYL